MAGGTSLTRRRHRLVHWAAALGLTFGSGLGAACSGDDDDTEPTTVPSVTTPPETAPPDTQPPDTQPPEPDDPLAMVREAVFRIETTGAYVEPTDNLLTGTESVLWGAGTGFVIDASGLAITNQHVVAGAATIEAYVEGRDEPVSARVVGASPCADLAVIDLEGDGYTALDWYEGEIEPGLEIFVPGFPLGDPEYTLVDGVVSKARSNGESPASSVDWVIEHTAPVQPGNSGSPIVTPDGHVVGVHYQRNRPGSGTTQYRAIAWEVALPLIEGLQTGESESRIGVNGQAVVDDETGLSGVWVSSVDSGSPAADAGVAPGDIVERLEGLPVGSDGTLATYCDVLRSHGAGDALSIQVLRFADDVRLRGTLNGAPLTPIESLGQEIADDVDIDEPTDGEPAGYDQYVVITDATGALEVEVPAEWTDINDNFGFRDTEGNPVGIGLQASPDLEAARQSWATPSMGFAAEPRLDRPIDELLGAARAGLNFLASCDAGPLADYDDGLYTGVGQLFTECSPSRAAYVLVAAEDAANDVELVVSVQIATARDFEALDRILQTFRVVGPVGTISEGLEDEIDVEQGDSYSDYREVTTDTGILRVEVPVEWTDVRTVERGLVASTNVDDFFESWGTPGVTIVVVWDWNGSIQDTYDKNDFSSFPRSACVETGVDDYEDALYDGLIGTYSDCGGTDTEMVYIVAAPPDREYVITIVATLVTVADLEALDRIIATFVAQGEGLEDDVEDGASYSYRELIDDTGILRVEVPVEWTDVDAGDQGLAASPDLGGFFETWGTPGVLIAVTSNWNGSIEERFDFDFDWFQRSDCVETGVDVYEDALYDGLIGTYSDCGGTDTEAVQIVAAPPDREYVIIVVAALVTGADLEALDRIIATFEVQGSPG